MRDRAPAPAAVAGMASRLTPRAPAGRAPRRKHDIRRKRDAARSAGGKQNASFALGMWLARTDISSAPDVERKEER